MGIFKKKTEVRETENVSQSNEDPLLRAMLSTDMIDRSTVLNIPSVTACVNKIADTVSSLDVRLYKIEGDRIEEVKDDKRTKLLNDDTGDTLNGSQLKRAMVVDSFLGKGGYAFIHRIGNEVKSIHYVEDTRVSFQMGQDPIFKDYRVSVNGAMYEGWQFIKLLRNTQNGAYGRSILEESPTLLSIVHATQTFEKNLVKTGGNKKGFIKSNTRLNENAMTALKNAFRSLYSNNTENVVILNDGLDFSESSNTSVEMQLNQNKTTNNDDICKIFLIPPSIINGGASEEDKKQYIEGCIVPILDKFAKAINTVLLLEEEKEQYFFAFDTTDLVKGDIEKRYNAYKIALESGFMQLDEVRRSENLPSFDLDFIKLGLQDVIFYPRSKQIYTPNTNKLAQMGEDDVTNVIDNITDTAKGGVEDENHDSRRKYLD